MASNLRDSKWRGLDFWCCCCAGVELSNCPFPHSTRAGFRELWGNGAPAARLCIYWFFFFFFSTAGLWQDVCSASVRFLINASFQPSARKSQLQQLEAKYGNLLSLCGCEPASLQLLSTTATVKLDGDI